MVAKDRTGYFCAWRACSTACEVSLGRDLLVAAETKRVIPLPIETDRCLLRALAEQDADDYCALETDPEVMRFLGGPTKRDAEFYREQIAAMTPRPDTPLAITEKETGSFLGRCGFTRDAFLEGWEINVVLARKNWHVGFATETIAALIHTAFNSLQLDTLFGVVHPENLASIALLKQFGFERQEHIHHPRWQEETCVYAIRPQT